MAGELVFGVANEMAVPGELTTLAEAGLLERAHLQEWVLAHPQILGDDVLVVTSEFGRWIDIDKRIDRDRLDVLGLDSTGHLVVTELKRGKAPDTVEMQALKYAALARRFTPDKLAAAHASFLTQRGQPTSPDEALRLLETHAGPLDPELLRSPKIVIAAEDYGRVLTSTVLYLIEQGIALRLLRIRPWSLEGKLVVTVSQELPLPDAEDYLLTPDGAERRDRRQLREEHRRERNSILRILDADLIEPAAVLTFRVIDDHPPTIQAAIRKWIHLDPKRERATWNPELNTPLRWAADGKVYSASDLTRHICHEATGDEARQNGLKSWVLDDGRDLSNVAGGNARTGNRSPEQILADAEDAGVAGVFTPFLDIAKEFDLSVRGYVDAINITSPAQRGRFLVSINMKKRNGLAALWFNHDVLAERTGIKAKHLLEQLPNNDYDPKQAAKLAKQLRRILDNPKHG
jgi:hypothetical protein